MIRLSILLCFVGSSCSSYNDAQDNTPVWKRFENELAEVHKKELGEIHGEIHIQKKRNREKSYTIYHKSWKIKEKK